jgi:hypothetical protein
MGTGARQAVLPVRPGDEACDGKGGETKQAGGTNTYGTGLDAPFTPDRSRERDHESEVDGKDGGADADGGAHKEGDDAGAGRGLAEGGRHACWADRRWPRSWRSGTPLGCGCAGGRGPGGENLEKAALSGAWHLFDKLFEVLINQDLNRLLRQGL